ncbi:RNA polymerase sigma factor [Adhaeribacter rhizoryzae]|uniref:Sigma-70 family RNA polymerase sigma factor n=1 Tax=Adhaeribacter rhizoryzae TaxID=2607907 RepID=A0A5M6DRM8_9BACT|nr:sigma-70 family RNA polymerase sigma factor [Adhaeribacter rhizoryzae]KAA5548840.1 sigma-70 family RNA polymerase sigma factor [Adhaeribacter rhizoryzae]
MELPLAQPNFSASPAFSANDENCWELFKSGNRNAFAELYQNHIQALFSYGTKICADNQVVEDCIQELFIYLWHNKENLSATNNIKYYLFKSLRRRIHQELEAGNRKNKLSTSFAYEQLTAEASPEYSLIVASIEENQRERMQQALLALTKRQQEAIYLRFYDNLSFQEIADIMGLQIKSTYNLISKAIEELREHVQVFNLSLFLLMFFPL